MLPQWDPCRLAKKIPFNVALVGGRKQGKSTAVSDLVHRMSKKFDLVVAFIGSAACNPVLSEIMNQHFDPRFFFSYWKPQLITKLMEQQEALGSERRSILILVDDIILSGKAEEQLTHLAMRGRHFGISLMMCAVSYTTLPKKARRSLDVLLVYSLPMQGDMKVMTWEFAHKNSMAEHVLRNLGEHEALVLETLQRRQQLFIWKADVLTVEDHQTEELPERAILRTKPCDGSPSAHRTAPHRRSTHDFQTYNQSPEANEKPQREF